MAGINKKQKLDFEVKIVNIFFVFFEKRLKWFVVLPATQITIN